MSRYTNSDGTAEFTRPGRTPRWFTTRYKSAMSDIEGPDADLGTATDRGYDPAIASFSTLTTGTSGVCEFPTGKAFSSGAQAMFFRTEIEGNTAGNLSVVMSFYEATYGDSAQVEVWTRIRTGVTMNDGDVVRIPTAGGRVLAHVDSISNPDNDASLYVMCRNASAAGVWEGAAGTAGGGEGVSEDELPGMGNYVWDATNDLWVRLEGSASGAVTVVQPTAALLNCTEASAAAILAKVTELDTEVDAQGLVLDAIQTATELLDNAVGAHDAATADAGIRVLGRADTTTPAAVGDGDDVHPWMNEYGAGAVFQTQGSDYTNDSMTTRETPASGGVPGTTAISNAATTPLNAGTSAACKRVTVCNNGTGWMRVGVGVQTATTGIVLQPGDTRTMDVDDIAKVQAWAQNNNDACGWDYETV